MDVFEELKQKLKGRIAILGIGNIMRGDDGFGSILAEHLSGKIEAVVFDAGVVPENFLSKVIDENPQIILICDTADFGEKAGEIKLLDLKKTRFSFPFSTHNISPQLLINFLKNSTNADIIFLVLQVKRTGLGQGLSRELKKSLKAVEDFLISNLPR